MAKGADGRFAASIPGQAGGVAGAVPREGGRRRRRRAVFARRNTTCGPRCPPTSTRSGRRRTSRSAWSSAAGRTSPPRTSRRRPAAVRPARRRRRRAWAAAARGRTSAASAAAQETPRPPRGASAFVFVDPKTGQDDRLRPHQHCSAQQRPRLQDLLPQGPRAGRHGVGQPRLRGQRVVAAGRGDGLRPVPPRGQPRAADRVRARVGRRQARRPPPDDRAAEPLVPAAEQDRRRREPLQDPVDGPRRHRPAREADQRAGQPRRPAGGDRPAHQDGRRPRRAVEGDPGAVRRRAGRDVLRGEHGAVALGRVLQQLLPLPRHQARTSG